MAKNKESGKYGIGKEVANPFFPHEFMYEGKGKSIDSPHGTIFDCLEVGKSNVMDERLKGRSK